VAGTDAAHRRSGGGRQDVLGRGGIADDHVDPVGEPIRALQHQAADDPAQSRHLSANRHGVFRVAEHVGGQSSRGPAVALGRQDQQQLRVPRAERVPPVSGRRRDGEHSRARVTQVEFGARRSAPGCLVGAAVQRDQPSSWQWLEPAQAERRQPGELRIPLLRKCEALDRGHTRSPGHPAIRVGDKRGPVDPGEHRRRRGPQRLEGAVVCFAQFALRHPGGGVDERERARVDGPGRAADVDDPEQLAAGRVVDRGGGAGPGVVRLHEMFG
jgi:hypothetical protein